MRPRCYNRPAFDAGTWMRAGYRYGKPLLRWVPRWFVNRCATHDGTGIGPNGETYPQAHKFDCTGCRWNPKGE
jgi:hypothetical protein